MPVHLHACCDEYVYHACARACHINAWPRKVSTSKPPRTITAYTGKPRVTERFALTLALTKTRNLTPCTCTKVAPQTGLSVDFLAAQTCGFSETPWVGAAALNVAWCVLENSARGSALWGRRPSQKPRVWLTSAMRTPGQ